MTGSAIERVAVYGYTLTYVGGRYVMSGGRAVTALDSTVVEVTTVDGVRGYGEVCPLGSTYLAASSEGARTALRQLVVALTGVDACNLAATRAAMDGTLRGHGYAKSAADVACWDVFGKTAGVPVATLLGGRRQESFPLYVAVPLGAPEEMAAFARRHRDAGIHAFQVKVGDDPLADQRRVSAVVEATGDSDVIVADANGGWRLQDAVVAVRLLEGLPRVHVEQPCRSLEECLAVRARTTLPMVLDEVIDGVPSLLRAYHAGAMEAVNLKISKVGGLTGAKLVRDLCEELGINVTIEDTWGGDLTTAATAHLAASTSAETLFTCSFMNDWTAEHVTGYQPRSEHGIGAAPEGAGLGVDVDVEMLGEPLFEARG